MEKKLFIEVLQHYSKCSEGEALQVLGLKDDFPYCQLLHTLSARLSKDHGLVDQSRELQLAAVYAADRTVLKDVMTLDNIVVDAHYKPSVKPVSNVAISAPRVVSTPTIATTPAQAASIESAPPMFDTPEIGSMAEQVLNDLEKLHQLKHNFEMMFVDGGASEIKISPEEVIEEVVPVMVEPKESLDDSQQSAKSKRERIIELARALEASKKSDATEGVKVTPARTKKTNPDENIIEEIVSTKNEIEPESPKQKEQLEIIEQFIKTQPSISNSKDKPIPPPGADLSTIKTGEFSDNIVSETLVEILLKQGKKDKAIEVLKKLIWKFPQKKAYFAAQIEELKK